MAEPATIAAGIVGIAEIIRGIMALWAEAERAKGRSEEEINAEYEEIKADLDKQEWNPYALPDV